MGAYLCFSFHLLKREINDKKGYVSGVTYSEGSLVIIRDEA